MSDAVSFRPMTEADLETVLKIEYAAYSHPWTRGIFLDGLGKYQIWLMFEGSQQVGHGVAHAFDQASQASGALPTLVRLHAVERKDAMVLPVPGDGAVFGNGCVDGPLACDELRPARWPTRDRDEAQARLPQPKQGRVGGFGEATVVEHGVVEIEEEAAELPSFRRG